MSDNGVIMFVIKDPGNQCLLFPQIIYMEHENNTYFSPTLSVELYFLYVANFFCEKS